MSRYSFILKMLLSAIISFVLDRLSKILIYINRGYFIEYRVIINNFIKFIYTENRGVALGLFFENKIFTILLPIILSIIFFALIKKINDRRIYFYFYIIIGAFLGNLYDRFLLGYVIDFIYFDFLPFFVCNVSDILICISMLFIFIRLFFIKGEL